MLSSFPADPNFDPQVQLNSFLFYWIKFFFRRTFSTFLCWQRCCLLFFSSSFVCRRLRCRFLLLLGFTALLFTVLVPSLCFEYKLTLPSLLLSFSSTYLKHSKQFYFCSMLIYCFICFDRQSHSRETFLRKVKFFTFSSSFPLRIPSVVSVEKGSNGDVNRERFSCLIRFSSCSKLLKVNSLESN